MKQLSWIVIDPVEVLSYTKISAIENNYFQGLWIPINLLLKNSDCTSVYLNVHEGKSCFHKKYPLG